MTPNSKRAMLTLMEHKVLPRSKFEGHCLSRLQYSGWVRQTTSGSNGGRVRTPRYELTGEGLRVARTLRREVRS